MLAAVNTSSPQIAGRFYRVSAMIPAIENARDQLGDLCRRFHVRRLDLFGSAARETDFRKDSDVDVIVDYDPAFAPPSIGQVFAFRDELSELFGRKVDLTMAGTVRNPFLRAAIERSRQRLHGA